MMPASNSGVGMNVGFPDVCNTIVGPATVPIPYPNLGMNSAGLPFCANVLISAVPGHNMGTGPVITSGDEAGVAHTTFIGFGKTTMGCPTVQMNGLPATSLLCPKLDHPGRGGRQDRRQLGSARPLSATEQETSLARPTLQEQGSQGRRAAYSLLYGFQGAAGAICLQEVHARVRFFVGADVLVDYETRYGEYFQLAADGQLPPELRDVHDFCVHRDGWTPQAVRKLLRRRKLVDRRWRLPSGEPKVECRKAFSLGLGSVEGALACAEADGGRFGLLAEGPWLPAQASLALFSGTDRKRIDVPCPHPFGRKSGGRGAFTSAIGWRAVEVFTYRFATTSAHLEDGGGYQPVQLGSY